MKKTANVLVTAAGSIVAQGIIKALKLANSQKENPVKYKIITTDMNAQAVGLYRSDAAFLIPAPSSVYYIDSITKICNENKINAIFIGSDEELLLLSKEESQIRNKTGAVVISNPINVIKTCFDKWKTFVFLRENKLPCANSCLVNDADKFVKDFGFPLVVKPRVGHGSIHFHVVDNQVELDEAISTIEKAGGQPIIQEFVKGNDNEFTTGITVDSAGKYVMSSIAIKKIIRHGQTYKAFIDNFANVRESAKKIALKLGCKGPINVQAKLGLDMPKVFEINARFSATTPIRAVAGINEPDITYRNKVLGEQIVLDRYRSLVCIRYLNEVYVPYSDYNKINEEKKIVNSTSFVQSYF